MLVMLMLVPMMVTWWSSDLRAASLSLTTARRARDLCVPEHLLPSKAAEPLARFCECSRLLLFTFSEHRLVFAMPSDIINILGQTIYDRIYVFVFIVVTWGSLN